MRTRSSTTRPLWRAPVSGAALRRSELRRCDCAEVGDRLSEFLDRELGTLDEVRVALHLAACPRCAAAAAGLAETIRAVRRLAGSSAVRPACRRR